MKFLFQRRHSNAQMVLFSLTLLQSTRAGLEGNIGMLFAYLITYGIADVFVTILENYYNKEGKR